MSFNPQTYLAKINQHERDKLITFDELTHTYTIKCVHNNGNIFYDSSFTSVTTWNHSHFSQFNNDKIIEKMMNSPKWIQNKYYGMSKQEIKDLWEKNRNDASKAGTHMHYDIECYYNNVDVSNNSIEFTYFKNFEKDRTCKGGFGENLKPYRTEWMIFDEELRLSGSVDMVYIDNNGMLQIYDWKRSKEIKKTNIWQSSIIDCINHLPDCNFWHYTLQLNTYKSIIERNYNKIVTDLYLVVLHPDNDNYKRIKVPILKQEIEDLFELRKKIFK
jgi:ATP-dependent exoDNAse (exonuclease V) beta subunit